MGFGLYVNTLVYAYLRLYGEHESADQLGDLMNRLEVLGEAKNPHQHEGLVVPTKPYYALDPVRRYRQLGSVTNRGIELSLSGKLAPGLTLLAGTVLLDPQVSGEAVALGQIGPRPVGQLRRRSLLNLDWRSQGGTGPLSFELGFESLSGRTANAANTLTTGGSEEVTLGTRYRFSLGGSKLVLRAQVMNVFNDYNWLVSPSGGFTYSTPRSAELQLLVDF